MPIRSVQSQMIRDKAYESGKATGHHAQETRELESKAMTAVNDELDYLQSLTAKDDETAIALKDARNLAQKEYDMAAETERSMVGMAMKHIHMDLAHLHDKFAALEAGSKAASSTPGSPAAAN